MRKINRIIIHTTATRPQWWHHRSVHKKAAEVRRWHVQERGWSDIGYHLLIDRDGEYCKGRALNRAGAHTRGHNKDSIGIALFGGYGGNENDKFLDHYTKEQDETLRSMIEYYRDKYGDLTLHGHNEFAAKACPCFQVSEWWEND